MAKKRLGSPKKYSGALSEPIAVPSPPAFRPKMFTADFAAQKAAHDQKLQDYESSRSSKVHSEQLDKLPLLLDHYGISRSDPERWHSLAFKLAIDHVDGFKIATPPQTGRPRHDFLWYAKLWCAVESLKRKNTGMKNSSACKHLAKTAAWKPLTGRTLNNELAKAKKTDLVSFFMDYCSKTPSIRDNTETLSAFFSDFERLIDSLPPLLSNEKILSRK